MPATPLRPPLRVTPHGAFGFARKTTADGRCGYANRYPCVHRGVDLAAPKGTPVYAPESGAVVVSASDNDTPPLRGYGPGAVVFLGDSGLRHVLGHMDPAWWSELAWVRQLPGMLPDALVPDRVPADGRRYAAGQQIGVVAKDHLHWEVSLTKSSGGGQPGTRIDPIAWARTGSVSGGGRGSMLWLLALVVLASR